MFSIQYRMVLSRSDNTYTPIGFYVIMLCASLSLISWHLRDRFQQYSWIIFTLWAITFILSLGFVYIHISERFKKKFWSFLKKDALILIGIALGAGLLRFAFISHYPYLALGDEIRDSGLNAYKIQWGLTKDMFGLGDYNGYGNFIPLMAYPFIYLFGNSVLMYRIPAAIVGVTSICLTYAIARIYWGRLVGIAAAAMLAVSVFHLHYSRVELLVILDSFLGTLIILSYIAGRKNIYGIFFLGLMYGFTMHFYAGIRGILLILVSFVICSYFFKLIKQMYRNSVDYVYQFKRTVLILFVFSAGFMIALGPSLNIMLQVASENTGVAPAIYKQDAFLKLDTGAKITYLADLYVHSFLVYISVPTNDEHISYHRPLLPIPVSGMFVVGLLVLGYMLFKKQQSASGLMLFLAFLFPITNEVSVNHYGADHRMMSIMPVLYIISAIGLVWIVRRVSFGYVKTALVVCITIFAFFALRLYFIERPSDILYQFRGGHDYKLQHILERAQQEDDYSVYILNDPQYDYIFPQYVEKMRFFLMGKYYTIINRDEFIASLDAYMQQSRGGSAYYLFEKDTELEKRYTYREYEVLCYRRGLLPDYECPIDFTGRYTYYKIDRRK